VKKSFPLALVAGAMVLAPLGYVPLAYAAPVPPCNPNTPAGFEQCLGGGFNPGDPYPWHPIDCYGQHPVDYRTACGPHDFIEPH
jgi:hypothetical protein